MLSRAIRIGSRIGSRPVPPVRAGAGLGMLVAECTCFDRRGQLRQFGRIVRPVDRVGDLGALT
jgi:hypothetical protein